MRLVINAIEGEFRGYKSLAEGALAQLDDEQLRITSGDGNSVATLVQHLGGNLQSRFSGFLDQDGEKPWRDREAEFADQLLSRNDLVDRWENGWRALFETLGELTDEHLGREVVIRGVSLSVVEALSRSVTHASYHVGQIVLIARAARGSEWNFLSIPPGGSAQYNADPTREKPPKS